MIDIDQVRLNFNAESLGFLKIIIALIMFGVSLDLKLEDFIKVFQNPKGLFAGFLSQLIFFPLFTFLLLRFVEVKASIALGLIMIAACPGGSMSNLMTSLAKGNVALSVGLTSLSTLLSLITTPLILVFLGEHAPGVTTLLKEIQLNRYEMLEGVFLILGIPLVLGMVSAKYLPDFSQKIQKVMNKVSVFILVIFVCVALVANYSTFANYFHVILSIVFLHNLLAIISGFLASKLFFLSSYDTRAVMIEVAFKNSGLGLALIFQFFGGLGGSAMAVAWWGVWQTLTGMGMLLFWRHKEKQKVLA